MLAVRLADRLFFLEVESDNSFIGLLDRLLLLDAFQVLLLVLRDLLCVESNAVSLSCVSLGGRGRVSVPSSRDAVAVAAMASPRTHLCWKAVDATLHANQRPQDAGAGPSRSSVSFCVRW